MKQIFLKVYSNGKTTTNASVLNFDRENKSGEIVIDYSEVDFLDWDKQLDLIFSDGSTAFVTGSGNILTVPLLEAYLKKGSMTVQPIAKRLVGAEVEKAKWQVVALSVRDSLNVLENDVTVTVSIAEQMQAEIDEFKDAEAVRVQNEIDRESSEGIRASSEVTRGTNESTRQSNEVVRVNNEGGRVSAESSRVTAEQGRVSAEGVRVGAEQGRVNAEGLRVSAEQGRASAESTRVTQETGRVNAEGVRESSELLRIENEIARNTFVPYSGSTAYQAGNKVSYLGSSYVAKSNTTGNLPTNTTYWLLIAQKGDNTTANDVTFTPTGDLSSTNVHNALAELDSEKQAVLTGGVTTIATTNLTASRGLVSDANGKVAVSAVTSAELGHLAGVTSAIQTQFNARAPIASPTFTGTVNNPITVFTGTTATDLPPYSAEFLTGTGWTSTGWTGSWATGWANNASNTSVLSQSTPAVISTRYQIAYTVTGRTTGSFTLAFGGQSLASLTATGAFGPTATTTAGLTITPTSDFNGTIVVSIRSITAVSFPLITGRTSSSATAFEIRANTASGNLAIGTLAGGRITTGIQNTAIGVSSLQNNTTGGNNTAVGVNSLLSNTTGGSNTVIGVNSLSSNTTGIQNTAIGVSSLLSNTTGASNTAVGVSSGRFIADGVTTNTITNSSIFIGHDSRALANDQTNQIVIGATAIGNGSNTATLGNASIASTFLRGNVAVGTGITPTAPIDIGGNTLRIRTARTPASATATGNAGDICWDATHIYVCIATNVWRRIAHGTW